LSSPANYPGLAVYGADVISSALRSIGAVASGEQPTPAEMQNGLLTLNQMLDAWQTMRLLVYAIVRYVYAPTALQQTYTVGPGGNINIARPARISSAGVINQPGSSQPNELAIDMISENEWRDIPVKNTVGALPLKVWDDNQYPLRNLNYWPIPSVQVDFTLYMWQLLTQFADTSVTLYTFPPAYLRAIRYNLAVELSLEVPGDPELMPGVMKLAADSLSDIKHSNPVDLKMACDPALVNPKMDLYNWLTDMPAGR
jgi:hypothetical protein